MFVSVLCLCLCASCFVHELFEKFHISMRLLISVVKVMWFLSPRCYCVVQPTHENHFNIHTGKKNLFEERVYDTLLSRVCYVLFCTLFLTNFFRVHCHNIDFHCRWLLHPDVKHPYILAHNAWNSSKNWNKCLAKLQLFLYENTKFTLFSMRWPFRIFPIRTLWNRCNSLSKRSKALTRIDYL